jgi:hypothetical protein
MRPMFKTSFNGLTGLRRWNILARNMRNVFLIITTLFICICDISGALAQGRPEVGGRITTGPAAELMSIAIEDIRIPIGFQTLEDTLLVRDIQDALFQPGASGFGIPRGFRQGENEPR